MSKRTVPSSWFRGKHGRLLLCGYKSLMLSFLFLGSGWVPGAPQSHFLLVSQFGNQPPPEFSPKTKKPKISPTNCDSIILECRSVRVGTLRRMVTKPVVVRLPL